MGVSSTRMHRQRGPFGRADHDLRDQTNRRRRRARGAGGAPRSSLRWMVMARSPGRGLGRRSGRWWTYRSAGVKAFDRRPWDYRQCREVTGSVRSSCRLRTVCPAGLPCCAWLGDDRDATPAAVPAHRRGRPRVRTTSRVGGPRRSSDRRRWFLPHRPASPRPADSARVWSPRS